jgi:mannose-6-phosphate isomerase class I
MPLYENRKHAENKIELDPDLTRQIILGFEPVIEKVMGLIQDVAKENRTILMAFDGYYGIDWKTLTACLADAADQTRLALSLISVNKVFKPQDEINEYKKQFTDIGDPGFGFVNMNGKVQDLMLPEALVVMRKSLEEERKKISSNPSAIIVLRPGAAVEELIDLYDLVFYFDKTRQPILWDMWDGKLVPFGTDEQKKDYSWKEYYYNDYYMLDAQKSFLIPKMNYWVEGINPETYKLIPRHVYDELIKTILLYPIKQVTIFQPGPWGAYRYKDFFDVPGLECNAWNETAGPELSLLIDVGLKEMINLPVINLLQYSVDFVGPYISDHFPRCFPLDVWLDDGYFPETTPAERTSMPIHNHPSTDYVRRHFNEIIGRYETYYIAEAYEGANTWMGFKEDADVEEWERLCRESNNLKEIPNWKDFIATWPTNVGDLFLIPPGTTHAHGGNQMVLEMDTSAGIAATEYSFFAYDFARPSWEDETKTMTGRPLKMHLDHSFDNDRYLRAPYVRDNLRARPIVIKWTKEYKLDRYTSYHGMPFEIERLHFEKRAEYSTGGNVLHIITLTKGKSVVIKSKENLGKENTIVKWQSAILPACFGDYEIINPFEKNGELEVVILRWKE